MMNISKSKYLAYKKCPKLLWMLLYSNELGQEDPNAKKRIEDGIEVGEYAKTYFSNTIDVTARNEDRSLNIEEMIARTNDLLGKKDIVIAEASFSVNGLFCSVDLLRNTDDGYEIYEVKASTYVEQAHIMDAAFQKYVLEKAGLKISKVYILHLNHSYIRKGDIYVNALLVKKQVDEDELFIDVFENLEKDLLLAEEITVTNHEPKQPLSQSCKDCPYKIHCQKNLPSPNVLDLNGIRGGYDYLNTGIVTYNDVLLKQVKLNKRQKVQIEAYLKKQQRIVDVQEVQAFLKTIKYPIYHLDFETIQFAIPPCDGAWPYEQIPTQYSLHIEFEEGYLEHREFLGTSIDPRREIAESLCQNIPMDACILAYNKAFECGRLEELAHLFPDLKQRLINMRDHVIDLIVPFKNGGFYCLDMGGSNSIKAVLPALYPDDSELDYHALAMVHNGSEAMEIYPRMLKAPLIEKALIRESLLKYCRLDTLAMVKVLRKLKEAVK